MTELMRAFERRKALGSFDNFDKAREFFRTWIKQENLHRTLRPIRIDATVPIDWMIRHEKTRVHSDLEPIPEGVSFVGVYEEITYEPIHDLYGRDIPVDIHEGPSGPGPQGEDEPAGTIASIIEP